MSAMKKNTKQSGVTLIEMTVVVAVIALLVGLGLPAVRALVNSLETQGGTKAMISASLASARAIAAKEQKYAGLRFQNSYDKNAKDKMGPQYMIFIVHDFDSTKLANGFRVVEGRNPIKLPETLGVMDLKIRINHGTSSGAAKDMDDEPIDRNSRIDESVEVRDTTTFSIIFSPSGKLVMHDVRVRNREGGYRPTTLSDSRDDIFNSPGNMKNHDTGMFVQDDYANLGLGAEYSRRSFVIYDKTVFEKANEASRYDDYLKELEIIYINPYMGTLIKR